MQTKAGTGFAHVDDGSVAALDDASEKLVDALAVVVEQIDIVRTVAAARGESSVDLRIIEVLTEIARAETVDDFGAAQEHARAILARTVIR